MMEHKKNNDESTSPVSRMFEGRSVFITGASGFIGRVLLEKLLRTYPGIRRIYILMRNKKNQSPHERLHKQLLKVPIFDSIRANNAHLFDKIQVIAGDIGEPQLGISDQDLDIMINDPTLSVVFHSAATIKFDEPLKVSVQLNLIATKTMIELCRKFENLLALCHVSTAYANSHLRDNRVIEERLYSMKEKPEHLIQLAELMDESLMQDLKMKLVDLRPNTYTYTKALAEHMIVREAMDLPIAIVRPSIVVAAWKEPMPGWIDNLNGPTGLVLAIGKGLLRSLQVDRNVKADLIPVDVVVNTMIASAFYAARVNDKLDADGYLSTVNSTDGQAHKYKSTSNGFDRPLATICENNIDSKCEQNGSIDKPSEDEGTISTTTANRMPPIIHVNSGHLNPIKWGEMEATVFPIIRQYPSCQVLRYPFGSFKGNKYHDLFARILAHYLPALIIDLLCVILGKKRQLLSVYFKLHAATAALHHFCNQNYNFKSEQVKLVRSTLKSERDQRELYMDIESLDWMKFWDSYVLGARRYVLKEPDHTLEEARKSFKRAYYIEIGLRIFLILIATICILPLAARLASIQSVRVAFQALNLVRV